MSHSDTDPLQRLLAVMARLRDPAAGCPWDIRQTFQTIAPYTIEEAYEVADAIEQLDYQALKDELGDLLFQVVFHARMAEEQSLFSFDDVATAIVEKMLRRHPHVFGDARFSNDEELNRHWESVKASERADKPDATPDRTSVLDGVARNLPALVRAQKLQKRAASVGFDWPRVNDVADKLQEELLELQAALAQADDEAVRQEAGDLLFSVVNLVRHLSIDAETALREASAKFERRFGAVEQLADEQGQTLAELSLLQLDSLWERVKHAESDQ